MIPELPAGPFEILYADPPWDYDGREQFGFAGDVGVSTGGAIKQYATMPLSELMALDVASVAADSALLFLWTTGPQLAAAMQLMAAWSFRYATVAFVWDKERINPGYYTLSQTELCLVGKRGSIPAPRGIRNARQLIRETRGAHSAKPSEARRRIERMFPQQRKLEMFARHSAPGWQAWGNQAGALEIEPAKQLEMWGPYEHAATAAAGAAALAG